MFPYSSKFTHISLFIRLTFLFDGSCVNLSRLFDEGSCCVNIHRNIDASQGVVDPTWLRHPYFHTLMYQYL